MVNMKLGERLSCYHLLKKDATQRSQLCVYHCRSTQSINVTCLYVRVLEVRTSVPFLTASPIRIVCDKFSLKTVALFRPTYDELQRDTRTVCCRYILLIVTPFVTSFPSVNIGGTLHLYRSVACNHQACHGSVTVDIHAGLHTSVHVVIVNSVTNLRQVHSWFQ